MLKPVPDERDIELQSLRERLAEAEEILRAIRAGEIDALIVNREDAPAIYTLQSADSPYRLLVEQMREGALTLSGDGIILYCNPTFAQMVGIASDRLRGSLLTDLIENPTEAKLAKVIAPAGHPDSTFVCGPAVEKSAMSTSHRPPSRSMVSASIALWSPT